jgi:hypothetical protein
MKAAFAYGLLAAMVFAVAFLGWQCRHSFGAILRDDLLSCNCGSTHVSFKKAGTEPFWYIATCHGCGDRREVIDVDWCNPRELLNAWISEQVHKAQVRESGRGPFLEESQF